MPVADPTKTESTWSVPLLTFLVVSISVALVMLFKFIDRWASKWWEARSLKIESARAAFELKLETARETRRNEKHLERMKRLQKLNHADGEFLVNGHIV